MTDAYEDALSIGLENEEMINLGKAWCTNIRIGATPFGVGLIQQMSGLPISGGKFTCDFSRKPVGYAAMRLAVSAVEFFEDNCLGCSDRSPGNRLPNLRTWAEQHMAERDQREEAAAKAKRLAASERQRRVDRRTFIAGAFSAAAQEIVGLLNRLDADGRDNEAAEQLRTLARLAPEAFDEILDLLYVEAGQLRLPVLLEVLVDLDQGTDSSGLHSLCVSAVSDHWGRSAGCRFLSQHGVAEDLTEDLLNGVVFESSPSVPSGLRSGGEPAALLHYHSLCPDVVESRIASLLGHGNPARRAAAARAVCHVASTNGHAGPRLLSALLDALKFPEDERSLNNPTDELVETVGLVLRNAPVEVEAAVNGRWTHATPEYRVRLIRCFDSAVPCGSEQLSSEVARALLSRAVSVLSQPREPVEDALNQDYQRDAADLLKRTVPLSPTAELSTNTILYLLLSWLEHARVFAESEPDDGPLSDLKKMAEQAQLEYIARTIADAVVEAGRRDAGALVTTCEQMYRHTETTPHVRAKLVDVAGRVGAGSPEHTGDVLPLIYTAMLAQEQVVRAAGLRATEAIMRALPSESVPPLLAEAITPGLSDRYMIVVRAAVDAVRQAPPDLIDCPSVVKTLLRIARIHAPRRRFKNLTRRSIEAGLELAAHDDQLSDTTRLMALNAVNAMPAATARETLHRNISLRREPMWTDEAIRALRTDEDPGFERLGDRHKEELLQELSRRDLSQQQIESLEQTELSASRSDRKRLLLSADMFAELSRPDISSRLIRASLDTMPDTIEMRRRRRSLLATLLRFELEVAIASGDRERQQSIGEEVEALSLDEEGSTSEVDLLKAIQARIVMVEALGAIKKGVQNAEPLAAALEAYRDTSEPTENGIVWAFSELAEALVHGVRWAVALWSAEPNSERYSVAARIRAGTVTAHLQERWPPDLTESSQLLADLTDHQTIPVVAERLSRVLQPPRVTKSFRKPVRAFRSAIESNEQPHRHGVALLIRLDGEPVMKPTLLKPGAMHQFRVEARVNEWPAGTDTLEVTFLTIHPRDYLHTSNVIFTPDALEQPLEIRVAGERPANAPPLSLTARANFRRGTERIDTRLAGNTTLELTTFDSGTATPQNMPHTARHLQGMMGELQNRLPHLDAKDYRDVRLVLEGVLRYGHTVLDERLAEHNRVDEMWFQRELRFFLSADRQIGTRLTRGGGRAGGTTDLELGNIVLELKVENNQPVSLERATRRFANQPTQYASAGDSPVSLLVVLDASPKRAPAGVMGNDIGWAYPKTTSDPDSSIASMVGIAIIRTGFPRPSDFSR